MKTAFILLLTVSSVCYGYYRFPQCYQMIGNTIKEAVASQINMAVDNVKDAATSALHSAQNTAIQSFDYATHYVKETTAAKIDDTKSFLCQQKDSCQKKTITYISHVKQSVNNYALDLYCGIVSHVGELTNTDSIRHIFQSKDEEKKQLKPLLAGDIYELRYDISYKGHCLHARSRSLGRPHVGRSGIRYELPTGQHYSLCLPEDEGYIIMRSIEKIQNV